MAVSTKSGQHVQAKFFTKQPQYAIPDDAFFVPSDVGVDELNDLINAKLLADSSDGQRVVFDFMVCDEFLRVSLEEHLQSKGMSLEAVVDIHYVKRKSGPEPGETLTHDDWVSAARTLNSLILTGSYDGIARVWTADGELLVDTVRCAGHNGQPIKCVAWLADDVSSGVKRFVTGSHDETLLTWAWNQTKNELDCVTVCRGHARSVDCVAVSPDGSQFSSGSWDTMLKIWSTAAVDDAAGDTQSEEQRPNKRKKANESKTETRVPLMTLSGHTEGVSSVTWLDASTVCTASWDHSLRLWDLQQTSNTATFMGSKAFFGVAYSPFSKLLVASSADRHIRLYDTRVSSGADIKCTFSSHTAWVSCVAWSPTQEHQFISGSYDQLLKLWDTRCPRAPLYDMAGHDDKILTADWSTPQFMVSGGADNQLKIFKSSSESVLHGCEL